MTSYIKTIIFKYTCLWTLELKTKCTYLSLRRSIKRPACNTSRHDRMALKKPSILARRVGICWIGL